MARTKQTARRIVPDEFRALLKPHKIIVRGKARTEYADKKRLNGISDGSNFVEYFDGDFKDKLEYGFMSFEYFEGELYTVTVYQTNQSLNPQELHELGQYTQGQWSDGIGEGFEQFPRNIDNNEVYISPWYNGQEITVNQMESENFQ
ncbi:hypothetical protein DLAC_08430 [Tieghemostelium lacteum]|uniref:Uncharacterized protein n=1 Tax=Tieghemostelium lacteum TaxID=361077 RepID=A0A151ZBZ0_TIELA|nr:hypothetical protein DLAC_08430 [Tieghemostelium lacteum]|eukprot:KYQ91463.1 hypothetical protein DLAC_08430 [Tieghemostelium lacteum]